MAARFYKGASVEQTNKLSAAHKVPPPQSNTMKGMPNPIGVAGHAKNILTSKGGAGPKREGPVGSRGGSHISRSGRGTTTSNYRAASTGHPGRMEKLVGHCKMSSEK